MKNVTKKALLAIMTVMMCGNVMAQQRPQMKVDISEFSRTNTAEILEPGFTWWRFKKDVTTDTLIVDCNGTPVTCIVSIPSDAPYLLRSGWNKNFIQNTEAKAKNSRLTGDGVNVDPDQCGQFTLKLEGLPAGTHTLQTYHSGWANPATAYGWPITIKCNGKVVHENVMRTFQEPVAANASLVTTTFNVAKDGNAVEFEFSTSEDNPPTTIGTSPNRTPILNGFELNTVSITAQAKDPSPTAGDFHVDCDADNTCLLSWAPAGNFVKEHRLYIAADSLQMMQMTEPTAVKEYADTTYLVRDVYSMNTYWWRVDEVDQTGAVTQGPVWSFRSRHLAFNGAEGYGRFAYGGRGGIVYHVTNLLDDRNPGSFRYGMEVLTCPRTIVFDVGGYIPLNGSMSVKGSGVTIAGQTAPGKGVCFGRANEDVLSATIGMGGVDCIMRYIRNRVGTGETCDGMGMRGANHSIMDHCSMSWSIDEGFSCRESYNLTLQHSIIAEALNVAGHDHYDEGSSHGFAAVFGGDISSIHHNLLSNNSGRNPRLDGGMEGDGTYKGRVDYFNNVVYNWNAHPSYGEAREANFYSNYYKMGPATTRQWILRADVNQRGSCKGTESYYYMNNVLAHTDGTIIFDGTKHGSGENTDIDGGMWQLTNPMTVDWNPWVDTPFFPSYADSTDAYTAYKDVLSDCGCNLPVSDDVDMRQFRTTLNGTYEATGSTSGLKGLIDDHADAGERETYPETHRPDDFDTDCDGLPDWWEKIYGTNPNSPEGDFGDANNDDDRDGYTMLENYLDYMATPHFETTEADVTISLTDYFSGWTMSPTFSVSGGYANKYNINGSQLTITPAKDFSGVEFFEVFVTDTEIPAGKNAPAISKRRFALLLNNGPTGIHTLKASDNNTPNVYYNITGQRVDKAKINTAGSPRIIISNGRKYINR